MATIMIATDADWLRADLTAALDGEHDLLGVRAGKHLRAAVKEVEPEVVILDMQIGNMGGMACCMELRNESSVGRLPRIPILLLLDRAADVFLAQRCDADGWLIKPLDSLRIRRAVRTLLAGDSVREGVDVVGAAPASVEGADESAGVEAGATG